MPYPYPKTRDPEREHQMHEVIVNAVREGVRPEDVARLFRYSCGNVLRLCREAGVSTRPEKQLHEIVTRENLPLLVRKDENGCWVWPRTRHSQEYAQIGEKSGHRLAYELFHGPIPDGMYVLHRCDHPPCVNPEHLFLGTHVDNMHDCTAKGRRAKGMESGCSKLTDDQVLTIRKMRLEDGRTLAEIGKHFGISSEAVRRIASGTAWKHLPIPTPNANAVLARSD